MKSRFRYVFICAPALAFLLFASADAQSRGGLGGGLGSLKGKVKERNGKSLEGVTIRATVANASEEKRETKSDDKGEFEFANLAPGQYTLSFDKQGYKTFTTRKQEIAPGVVTKLSSVVEMSREGAPYAVIRGAVLYGAGYSLPNATVTIERIDGDKKFKQERVTIDGGEFSFRLKAEKAKYRVTASARGFQPNSLEIEIESDEARNVALTLQQAK
jgi:uncharacterized surface anchored protein